MHVPCLSNYSNTCHGFCTMTKDNIHVSLIQKQTKKCFNIFLLYLNFKYHVTVSSIHNIPCRFYKGKSSSPIYTFEYSFNRVFLFYIEC